MNDVWMSLMRTAAWTKTFLEYLGGASDTAPPGFPLTLGSLGWGVWWGVLASLVIVFTGQGSKFIYIDF